MPRALGGGATFRTVIYRAINKGVRSTFAEPERLGFMQKFSLLWKSYKCWVDGVGRQNGPRNSVSTPHAVKRQTLARGDSHLDTVTAIRRAGLVRHGSSRLRSKQGELKRRNRRARPIHWLKKPQATLRLKHTRRAGMRARLLNRTYLPGTFNQVFRRGIGVPP
jgi:hypothetical protein